MIFKDLHRNSTGVTNCPTCKDRPCQVSPPPTPTPQSLPTPWFQNQSHLSLSSFRTGGLARTLRPACINAAAPEASQAATASITPRCTAIQVPGIFLPRPQSPGPSELTSVFVPRPWTEACGPDATCINRPNGLGYDCRCHLGKSGNKCTEGKEWCCRTVLVQ